MSDYEITDRSGIWSWIKIALCLACVGLALNGLRIKSYQAADLARETVKTLQATAQHTADANEVINWAAR